MNLTVGPLPPAVYWRRRAIVLGGLLLVVLLVVYACSGTTSSNASGHGAGRNPSPTPGFNAPVGTTDGLPSTQPLQTTQSVPSTAPASPSPSVTAPLTPSPSPSAASTGTKTCTDGQIRITPVISSTSSATGRLVHGGTFELKLKVRNVSSVTCKRDVGDVPEELRIMSGKKKIWSSDDCVSKQGKPHDIRTFGPDVEIYAALKWDSYDITTSSCKKSSTPAPVGSYALVGRVGTKTATTKFSIVH